jgi:quercetin dioxygenase-like cupin family protein
MNSTAIPHTVVRELFAGNLFTWHVTTPELSLAEVILQPGGEPALHVHEREDELTYVVEGEIGARVGADERRLAAGVYLWKPRRVPHAFWNASVAPARIIDVIVPAGFERFFLELSELLARRAAPEEIDEAGRRYGHTIVPEWIPHLERSHGVRVRG